MSTFVLIHGAWHGAWCWYKTTSRLELAGHKVIAPDLPGLGRDRTPISEVSLAGWADYVCDILQSEGEDLILVGHSRGGIVISEIAERIPDQIKYLVYVAAMLVPNGITSLDLTLDDNDSLLQANLQVNEEGGYATIADSAIADLFYGECPVEDIALAKTLLLPEPIAPSATPLRITSKNFGRVPRIYIECLKDKAVPPSLQEQMYTTQICKEVISMDTDHSPFFSRPDEFVSHLLALT